ncbi:DUF6456 domain-containing protein [Roseivivax sp. GX 12232]|uniref:DUF6456 domain-containing protein n=1 Tax=Roseivivax sp. GX 12232 TaxID=2900547 RepID=UPI001E523239|nr:DUF6456 domain-containing protein [Roseivivax sp. GX 12232]MCE0504843.1 DUF6456 domain-containing protein [Roseivivax sp. GX 12232]
MPVTEQTRGTRFPGGVPAAALHYLEHTEGGISLRALARRSGVHASTILRQIRRLEMRRDDPLVDAALTRLGEMPALETKSAGGGGEAAEQAMIGALARLAEPGAVLAVARDMDKAVVVRDEAGGGSARLAVLRAEEAEAMALRDWIACASPGRISRYRITAAGRQALARQVPEAPGAPCRPCAQDDPAPGPRFCAAEAPLTLLARRRSPDGRPFLQERHVTAGRLLREDFELSGVPPRAALAILRGTPAERALAQAGPGHGPARARFLAVLERLGPGLGDVALRCCCLLEGIETIEKRLGWSARSGKVVLRIALERLAQFYRSDEGQAAEMIG